jgi:signal transduction histidine kinase
MKIQTNGWTIAGVALLYFVSGKASLLLSVHDSIVTIAIFFAEGVSLAAVLIYGRGVWPGIFLGQFLLAVTSGLGWVPSLLIAGINSVEALLGLAVLQHLGFDRRLSKTRDLFLLFAVIAFVLQPFSALGGNLVLLAASAIPAADFFRNLFAWWFGNVMGQLLVTPLLLILYAGYCRFDVRRLFASAVFFTILGYTLFFVFPVDNLALLLSITVPLSILFAAYVGLSYAAVAILILSLAALLSSHIGVGPFTTRTATENLININFYILAHAFVLYTWGTLSREKEEAITQLAHWNKTLESRVEEEVRRNREKEKLMFAQSRQAQMGEAINMITHQWRQPLNTLSLLVQGVGMKFRMGKLDEKGMETFQNKAYTQIRQMSETIDDFRDFFRPQRKKVRFEVAPLLHRTIDILSPLYEKAGLEVTIETEESLYVNGYPNELGQVVLNLLNNAKDAIVASEHRYGSRILVSAYHEGDTAYITIEDTGGGIPETVAARIFEPYFSTKSDEQGTGLGLYMSKIIVEEHLEGKIGVENTPTGARFTIELPARQAG